jgi:hypothetical protein
MIPSGLSFPFSVPADKITGRIGKIHGDKTVKIPAKKAKIKRSIF